MISSKPLLAKIRVLIVDDSPAIQGLFSQMLSSDSDIEVVDVASDPFEAREKIKRYNPDVITLDVEMPRMDGLSFLEKIMSLRPMPVVMASTLTAKGADVTMRALEMGAVDYITKPSGDPQELTAFRDALCIKVRNAALSKPQARVVQAHAPAVIPFLGSNTQQLVAVGSSTGGVEALRDILIRLPANSPAMVVTQHMPPLFTSSFAKRLDGICEMQVVEAAQGMVIEAGHVYIAAGNFHLEVRQQGGQLICDLVDSEAVSGHRPSVDVMFDSVAKLQRKILVGVILTGMGHDGAKGLLAMRQAGAKTLGQNEASCVVYGMPRVAMQAGAVEKEVPLVSMAGEILKLCQR